MQNIGRPSAGPLTITHNINTKYTDSGRLKSVLKSPKMLELAQQNGIIDDNTEIVLDAVVSLKNCSTVEYLTVLQKYIEHFMERP